MDKELERYLVIATMNTERIKNYIKYGLAILIVEGLIVIGLLLR
jgi:hypothetical protein